MSKRIARPGMDPSPNQQRVLDALVSMYELRAGPHRNHVGLTIDQVADYLSYSRIGGGMMPLRPDLFKNQQPDGWVAWSRSTVRDHLNDLVGKGHVEKKVIKAAYYRPVKNND